MDPSAFNLEFIYCLDTKRNMIMEGNFTKIIYSDDCFTSNGLYLSFPVQLQKDLYKSIDNERPYLIYQPYCNANHQLLQYIAVIESQMIEYYKKYSHSNKCAFYGLRNQIYGGNVKYYRENTDTSSSPLILNYAAPTYIIKIAGFWETSDQIGITYKFLQVHAMPNLQH